MSKSKQQSFFEKQSLSFGGSQLGKAHARKARPLSSKDALHIVLKSDIAVKTADSDLRLTTRKDQIEKIIKAKLGNYGIRIHTLAVASNHIHLLISFKSRKKFFNWIKRITGLTARLVLSAEKGKPSEQSLWTYRPFTRVVFWGRDFRGVVKYILMNILEATGFAPYTPRGGRARSTA